MDLKRKDVGEYMSTHIKALFPASSIDIQMQLTLVAISCFMRLFSFMEMNFNVLVDVITNFKSFE